MAFPYLCPTPNFAPSGRVNISKISTLIAGVVGPQFFTQLYDYLQNWSTFHFLQVITLKLRMYCRIQITTVVIAPLLLVYALLKNFHCAEYMFILITVSLDTGRLGGYRSMHRLLRQKHHVSVTQEMVRIILCQMDPMSVMQRRRHRLHRRTYSSRGPNHVWHVDGYDKLRCYGILISGCVRHFE